MARPREFDFDEVVDQGMQLLWSRGYEATSLDELLSAMCLSKSSFYETFGSKHDFLLIALTRYIDVVLGQLRKDLEEGSARSAVTRSFEQTLPTTGKPQLGCFVQNCAIELAQRDPEAQAKVREGLKRFEEGYYRAVLRGQENGEFTREKNARALARYLTSSYNGLQVMTRSGFDRRALREVVQMILQALD
jgi:TetR/AcrR family transcriptional repressor of nem operon